MAEGIVVSIHLASGATEPMRGVAEARAVPGRGLEGDRYFEGRGTFSGSPDTELTLTRSEVGRRRTDTTPRHGGSRSVTSSIKPLRRDMTARGVMPPAGTVGDFDSEFLQNRAYAKFGEPQGEVRRRPLPRG